MQCCVWSQGWVPVVDWELLILIWLLVYVGSRAVTVSDSLLCPSSSPSADQKPLTPLTSTTQTLLPTYERPTLFTPSPTRLMGKPPTPAPRHPSFCLGKPNPCFICARLLLSMLHKLAFPQPSNFYRISCI